MGKAVLFNLLHVPVLFLRVIGSMFWPGNAVHASKIKWILLIHLILVGFIVCPVSPSGYPQVILRIKFTLLSVHLMVTPSTIPFFILVVRTPVR